MCRGMEIADGPYRLELVLAGTPGASRDEAPVAGFDLVINR